MTDCIGILYSDSEFMDLTGFLILAPPVVAWCMCYALSSDSGRAGSWGANLRDPTSEQEEEAREFTLSKRSGASGRDQSFSAFPALCPPS